MLTKTNKIIVASSFLLIAFLSFGVTTSNAVHQKILIYLNGEEKTKLETQLIDGRVYAPVRSLAQSMGSEVSWDNEKQAVLIDTDIKRIASIPDEKTYLYAMNLNKEKNMYTDLILSINGVKKVFDWKTIALIEDLPELINLDLNQDQKKETVILLSKGRGTGSTKKDIHVVNPENLTEYRIENPLELIKNNVTTKIRSETEVEIKVAGQISNVKLDKVPHEISAYFPKKISEIKYENYIDYQIINNKITATIGVEGDFLKYIGNIIIEYSFTNGEFKMSKISFEKTNINY